jgi:hypothetical protein
MARGGRNWKPPPKFGGGKIRAGAIILEGFLPSQSRRASITPRLTHPQDGILRLSTTESWTVVDNGGQVVHLMRRAINAHSTLRPATDRIPQGFVSAIQAYLGWEGWLSRAVTSCSAISVVLEL